MTDDVLRNLFEFNTPLIGERWLPESSGGVHAHLNPSDGRAQADVRLGGAQEIHDAVPIAKAAAKHWQLMGGEQRRRSLERWAQSLEQHAAQLTRLAARESGIPIRFGGGVAKAVSWIRYYAGWADRLGGNLEDIRGPGGQDGLALVRREPYGVVGIIIPWNFPLIAIGMKVGAALAAGNAVILKPPSLSPFVALKVAALALEAGLPPGVLNVIPGDAEAGDALVRAPQIGKVSFTGGEGVARRVMVSAAETLKPLALELGGKSANLLFDDADLDSAVATAALNGCVYMSGQGCALPTRLLVQERIYDEVLERVARFANAQVQGDAEDPAVLVGPVISALAQQRILGLIERAREQASGRLLAGGGRPAEAPAGGYFIAPTVFADVDATSALWRDEFFGPVLSVGRFRTEEEAIKIANDSRFGLGAMLSTRQLGRALRVARELEAGMVWINGFNGPQPQVPFGGMKQSGFGREGGREGLEEFLQSKSIWVNYEG
jgi:aldehyde dehydrogenase (NAD+)